MFVAVRLWTEEHETVHALFLNFIAHHHHCMAALIANRAFLVLGWLIVFCPTLVDLNWFDLPNESVISNPTYKTVLDFALV